MHALLISLTLLFLPSVTYQSSKAPSSKIVAEEGVKYSFKDDVLKMRGSGGWLRTVRFYLDFDMSFDFRVTTADTNAGVTVRGWQGGGGYMVGYRFRLPTDMNTDTSSLFVGHTDKPSIVHSGQLSPRPAGEWQHVTINGEGQQITITLNQVVLGAFRVEEFGGHLLLDSRNGEVEMRNITMTDKGSSSERPGHLLSVKEITDAGGKPPKLEREVKPRYTAEAMSQKVQGVVKLEIVVLTDGTVGAVVITRSLDPDLDHSAIAAVKRWRLKPGLLHGKPVPALAEAEVSFALSQ